MDTITLRFADGTEQTFEAEIASKSHHLTEEELANIHRLSIVSQIIPALFEFKRISFLAISPKSGKINLIKIEIDNMGEYSFTAADHHFYSFDLEHVVAFVEDLIDGGAEFKSLNKDPFQFKS